jgi:hypothetical protein
MVSAFIALITFLLLTTWLGVGSIIGALLIGARAPGAGHRLCRLRDLGRLDRTSTVDVHGA